MTNPVNLPPILLEADWKAYGLPKSHELRRLLDVVESRRARARTAWEARDAAKAALGGISRRAEAAVTAAVNAGEELPDTAQMRRAAEEALTAAQDVVAGVNASVAAAERDVVTFLRREGSDVRDKVAAALEKRAAAASDALRQAVGIVATVTEAAELLEAADPDRPHARDDEGRSLRPARQGADARKRLREALELVEHLGAAESTPALHVAAPVRSA